MLSGFLGKIFRYVLVPIREMNKYKVQISRNYFKSCFIFHQGVLLPHRNWFGWLALCCKRGASFICPVTFNIVFCEQVFWDESRTVIKYYFPNHLNWNYTLPSPLCYLIYDFFLFKQKNDTLSRRYVNFHIFNEPLKMYDIP